MARYIPEMMAAEILDVKFGIVQTKGEMSLQDLRHREGPHHLRNYHSVREEMQGLISNPAMKLFYFVQNGIEVRKIFDIQEARDKHLRLSTPPPSVKPQVQDTLSINLFRPAEDQGFVPSPPNSPQTSSEQNFFCVESLRRISVCFIHLLACPKLIGFDCFSLRQLSLVVQRASFFESAQQEHEQLDPHHLLFR